MRSISCLSTFVLLAVGLVWTPSVGATVPADSATPARWSSPNRSTAIGETLFYVSDDGAAMCAFDTVGRKQVALSSGDPGDCRALEDADGAIGSLTSRGANLWALSRTAPDGPVGIYTVDPDTGTLMADPLADLPSDFAVAGPLFSAGTSLFVAAESTSGTHQGWYLRRYSVTGEFLGQFNTDLPTPVADVIALDQGFAVLSSGAAVLGFDGDGTNRMTILDPLEQDSAGQARAMVKVGGDVWIVGGATADGQDQARIWRVDGDTLSITATLRSENLGGSSIGASAGGILTVVTSDGTSLFARSSGAIYQIARAPVRFLARISTTEATAGRLAWIGDRLIMIRQAGDPALVFFDTAQFPAAVINAPADVQAGEASKFGSTTSPGDGETTASRSWSFGDGEFGGGGSPTHTYAKAGTYTVRLVLTASDGSEAYDRESIIAAPGVSAPGNNTPAPVTLDLADSIALSGIPAMINFGDGVPGDSVAAPPFSALIVSDDSLGYRLTVTTTDLTGPNGATIDAVSITYAVTALTSGVADGGRVVSAVDPLLLAHAGSPTSGGGDEFRIAPTLDVPFVAGASYQGTASFVASGL